MKVLAIDYGSRRIGLAVGDALTRIASPLGQIAARDLEQVAAEIRRRIAEFEIGHIVVGYPLHEDGSPSRTCAQVDRFVHFLRKRIDLPISLVDETLSSVAAEEMAKEIEHDFRKRKKFLDSVAAQVILQSFFEKEVKR